MSKQDFPDGAALVFGGSGGIGRAVAKTLAEAGTDVAIAYRSKADVAESVAEDIRATGVKASTHATDVTDPAKVKATIEEVAKAHGRIHTVVFGAGPLVEQVLISELTPELWQRAVDTETKGFFNVISASLPHMKAGGGGSFVHMGSAGHLYYPQKDGLSVIPKAANEALVKGIAKEEGVNNIRANSVLIGVIDAGMFHTLSEQGVFDEAWIKETQKMLCLKRWGDAEEVGNAVTFLASNKAAYVTGQQINVSGGFGV
ncbi:MAG: SDR family NAD(P)-dependent oxidoreductase [Salinisphaeraceae bacterium]|nr:SDR family NAD(P)-dependent oxidoreductase [Salinisphaeraceae bacterium]